MKDAKSPEWYLAESRRLRIKARRLMWLAFFLSIIGITAQVMVVYLRLKGH